VGCEAPVETFRVIGWREGREVVKLGDWTVAPNLVDPNGLLSDRDFLRSVAARMRETGADVSQGIFVRWGRRGHD
jgi:hypothetical protein